MKLFKRSLRTRIFFSMILLVLIASVLIAAVSIYQYKQEAIQYHKDKLERKEAAIRASINYELETTTYEIETENIPLIFKDKIYEISNIHNVELNMYDLNGNLLKSSTATFFKDSVETKIPQYIIEELRNSGDKRFVKHFVENGQNYQSSYTYITDNYFKPLGILNLPSIEDDGFIDRELNEFLMKLLQVYVLMMLIAVVLAYFLSKYITKSLKTVSEKIIKTRLDQRNKKIKIEEASREIHTLVKAYNSMIDELEESAIKLARTEREQAWREMAKQVAHEIKNPLTPMRLSVQSFQRKFDPNDPKIDQKVKEYSNTLIHQIDTMSSIASAFSNFAKMPAQQNETLNVPKIVKLGLDIFNEDFIVFKSEKEEILAKFDRTQLIRVITNLVKNAIQATSEKADPKVMVNVREAENQVLIEISDNGAGIPEVNKDKVFEPKFTTKSSGMGLGLGMVKNIVEAYGGNITFTSEMGMGTVFLVKIPRCSKSQ
ncbi:MAG TPA: HAMP domain-containing sensor histidine kinase [Flavobacteriaceae bacterium]|nr:HAMP domain-containing sensor histidine kinase [Flavobacteriaceae bacterium]